VKISGDLGKKLGEIDVHDGLEEEDSLVLVRELEFEVASSRQNGLDGTHAVVIMMLGRQLLRAQLICCNDLLR